MSDIPKKMNRNVTLVLSGGGARGFAHIGAIEELTERGYTITSIAGTSMGALVGGVYAAGKLDEFKQWACNLDKKKIFRLIDFSFSNQGLIKCDRVLNTMKEFIPDAKIEDLPLRYTATAFDLANNKEVVFTSGSLYDAIRASISIPTVFTPVITGDSILVDGGVVNNIPMSNAFRTKDDTLIAVYVNSDLPLTEEYPGRSDSGKSPFPRPARSRGFRNVLMNTDDIDRRKRFDYFNLINSTIASGTNHLAKLIINQNPPDILIEVSRKSCGTFDFHKAESLVELGRKAAKVKLNSLNIPV